MTLTCAKAAPGKATAATTTNTAEMRPLFRRPKSAFSFTSNLRKAGLAWFDYTPFCEPQQLGRQRTAMRRCLIVEIDRLMAFHLDLIEARRQFALSVGSWVRQDGHSRLHI